MDPLGQMLVVNTASISGSPLELGSRRFAPCLAGLKEQGDATLQKSDVVLAAKLGAYIQTVGLMDRMGLLNCHLVGCGIIETPLVLC